MHFLGIGKDQEGQSMFVDSVSVNVFYYMRVVGFWFGCMCFVFETRFSLYSSVWPGTPYVEQAGLEGQLRSTPRYSPQQEEPEAFTVSGW